MISANKITKYFGKLKALDNVSLEIKKGELFGLLGPNGAGKTTIINILSTVLNPDDGEVKINGFDLKKQPIEARKSLGVVPQEIALYENLSAYYNVLFWGKLYGVPLDKLKSRTNELFEIAGLKDRMYQKIETYSGGMKRRINLIAALVHSPRIVFMDEPTVGIDPQSRNNIYEILHKLQNEGITIIYTTHYMEEAEKLCERIGIIDHGKIIVEGNLSELKTLDETSESIFFEFDQINSQQREKLRKLFGEKTIIGNNNITISTHKLNLDLPQIIKKIDKIDIHISSIDFQKKSLETLFLNLTGRKLRD